MLHHMNVILDWRIP